MSIDTARELAEHKLQRLARDSSDTVSFWRQATDVLRDVIPFDFHPCWFTVDPSTLLVTAHMNEGLDHTPPEIAQAWYAEGDVNSPAQLATVPGGVTTVTRATGGDALASWRWRNLLEPRGFDDSLDAVLRRGSTVWGAVSLLHSSESRPYTRRDLQFIAKLSEILATGTQLGLLRSEADAATAAEVPAVVIVTSDLEAATTTANAGQWLADLPDIGPYRPDRLPMPVQVIALRAVAAGGEASTVVRSASGRWLRVSGSRLADADEVRVAVVVEAATPQQLAPLRLAAFGLTPREREVVQQVLLGRSTREMADALFISEYTVQDRLKAIFEKMGIRSRRELVAVVHKSDYVPLLDANDERVRIGEPIQRRRRSAATG